MGIPGTGAQPSNRLRALFRFVCRAAVSAVLLAFVLWICDWRLIVQKLSALSPLFVLFAWAYYAGCQWLSACRWKVLLDAKDLKLPIGRLFTLYMIGMFVNSFLPGGLGGDAVKAFSLYRQGGNGTVAVASVVVERFCGIVALATLGIPPAVLLLVAGKAPLTALACLTTAFAIIAIAALVWSARTQRILSQVLTRFAPSVIRARALQLIETVHSYRHTGQALTRAFVLSLLLQAAIATYYSLTGLALGAWISPLDFLLVLPIVTIITVLPISLGGLGVRELTMVYLFSTIGLQGHDILAISLIAHVLNLALSLLGGVLLVAENNRKQAVAGHSA